MPDHPSQQRAPPTDTPGRYRPHQSSRKVLPMSSYHVESPGRVWKFMVGDLACPQPCTNGLLCICQKVNFGGFGAAQIMDDIGARCWSTIAQGKKWSRTPEHAKCMQKSLVFHLFCQILHIILPSIGKCVYYLSETVFTDGTLAHPLNCRGGVVAPLSALPP